jgi:hypothetical protein
MGTEKSPAQRVVDKFDERIDAALARWPRPDRRRDGADERVARILARIEREKGSPSNDRRLLNAPFWADALPSVRRANGSGPWLFSGAATSVILAAAAAVLVVSGIRRAPPPPPGTRSVPVRVAATANSSVVAPAPDDAVDLSSLPHAPVGDGGTGSGHGSIRRARSTVLPPTSPSAVAVVPSASLPGDPEPEPTVPVGAARTGASSVDPESVPLRPAAGAVESAVARVLPGARACLQPGQGVVRATITFGSSGRVRHVAVVGTEGNDPVASCVRGALADAKVGPFAMPAFVWTATVRGRQ